MTEQQPSHEASDLQLEQRLSLSDVLGRVAKVLEELPPGDVAELRRRMRPGGVLPRAFWLLYLRQIPKRWQRAGDERWAVILGAMAELETLHDPKAGFGRALAAIPLNERRFLQLARADGKALPDLVLTLSRYLRSKHVKLDLTPLARLILSAGTADDSQARRALARDFYTYFNPNE